MFGDKNTDTNPQGANPDEPQPKAEATGVSQPTPDSGPAAPPGSTACRPEPQATTPTVPKDQLARESRKLNLVGSAQLTRAVAEAVRRGLSTQFVFEEAQLEGAVRAIGRELMVRLRANSKSVRGVPKDAFLREVKADKKRIEAAREAARVELDTLLGKLRSSHEDNDRREAELVAQSQASGKVEDRELATRIAELFEGDNGLDDLDTLREKITALTLGSMQGERDKSIDAQMAEHRDEVANFERRIAKLTNSLELTEDELKRIAKAKNIEVGIGSIYRTVQGLAGDDDDYETKKELMSSIFAANLELQKGSAEAK